MKAKDLLKSSAFMLSMALVIALAVNFAGLFPGDVLDADLRSNITVVTLALMLTVSLSRIPFTNLNPLRYGRSVLRAVFLGLVLSSLIPLAGYYLLRDTEFAVQAMGLVFIAATPFAASVAPLSYILNGDMEHAARGTIVVYFVSLLWMPFIIWLTLGEVVDMTSVIVTVLEIIAVPLVLSRLLTRVRIDKDLMAIFLNLCVFLLVWLSVGSTVFKGDLWVFAAFLVIAALRSFGLGGAVEVVEKGAGIQWHQRVTDILMTSYKNKGIAIALCMGVLAPTGMAPLAMVAVATSIIVEVCWVIFMDSVLFSRRRMERELASESARSE
ncbi:MAG: Na+-dependent transporter [Candidatus Methanomethylophilaceae archaeon]|nr:Na+-dependent transporter [Candidatus Methanomethylophilaceae archaeon]